MHMRREGSKRPGPIFDRAGRIVIEDDPGAFCDWLGIEHEAEIRQLPATFAAETVEADFVAEIGPGRILNVEFVTKPNIEQASKLVIYRGKLMQRHPRCSIFQVAIMLRGGQLPDVDDPRVGFCLGLTRIYLNEVDPAELMTQPNLACPAVLAQGDEKARRHYLGEALRGLQGLPQARQEELVHAVLVMATMTVDPSTIDKIWDESGMTAESIAEYYSGTEIGRLASKINEKKAHDQGLEQGREQATTQALTAFLRARFGEHAQIPAIAENLAHSLDTDTSTGIVTEAKSLDDLSNWLEPQTS